MIFSTRYINESHISESIFAGGSHQTDSTILGEMVRTKLRLINRHNVLSVFYRLKPSPEKLVEIANILLKEDSSSKFATIPAVNLVLPIQIAGFIEKNIDSLSTECLTSLALYTLPPYCLDYWLREEEKTEENNKVIYRAIGIMHLPKGKTEYGRDWANILTKSFQYGHAESEEIFLCLHAGTDWAGDASDRLVGFSRDLSDRFSKKISVFLFHHDPQIYPIAEKLLSKDESLQNIWNEISKI